MQTLPSGTALDVYTIQGNFPPGGFGITYKAWDNELNRKVAIKEYLPAALAFRDHNSNKVLPITPGKTAEFKNGLTDFVDEAKALARFDHPNIVKVYNFFEDNGTAYMVMQYADGQSLDELLKAGGPLAEEKIMTFLLLLLDGLSDVHNAGLLHRDIKPSNIYIRSDGTPLLIDFGAAISAERESDSSAISIVSQGYAPTEQYGTKITKQGPWSDIYAIGATLYKCITGEIPIDAPTRRDAIHDGDTDPLQPAVEVGCDHYSERLLSTIDRCLAVDIKQRPQNLVVIADALMENGKSVKDAATREYQASLGSDYHEPESKRTRIINKKKADFVDASSSITGIYKFFLAVALLLGGGTWIGYLGYQNYSEEELESAIVQQDGEESKSDQGDSQATQREELMGQLIEKELENQRLQKALMVRQEEERRLARKQRMEEEKRQILEQERKKEAEEKRRIDEQVKQKIASANEEAKIIFENASVMADFGLVDDVKQAQKEYKKLSQYSDHNFQWDAIIEKAISTNKLVGDLIRIPQGTFMMGSDYDEAEMPKHKVKVSAFYIGKYEVTFSQWDACFSDGGCKRNPSDKGWGRGSRPVINIARNDIKEDFIPWLNRKTGKSFRLPSESEWEYAAGGGATTKYPWGHSLGSNNANCANCGSRWDKRKTAPVGSFSPNNFGLYDMIGNVRECVEDCKTDNYSGAPKDGSVWLPCKSTLFGLRGGSWKDKYFSYVSARFFAHGWWKSKEIGFRLAHD